MGDEAGSDRLRGHLERVDLEGGFWRLRLRSPEGDQPDAVVLGTPDELRAGFADGDAVIVTGQLDALGASVFMAGPRFVLESVEHDRG